MSEPKITTEEVERVARLARLSPSAEESARLSRDLSAILAYFDQLAQVDTSEVPATANAVVQASAFRADEPIAGLTREDALAAAPSAHDGGFAVPRVLEVES